MDENSSFRRSLRRINPFKNNFFRLPATPRLARSKKIGNGDDIVTEWNFERSSVRSVGNPLKKKKELPETPESPDTVSMPIMGISSKTASGPPGPSEAELSIHRHMATLMSSTRNSRLLQLPNTSYTADGRIREAYWQDNEYNMSPNNSTLSLLNTEQKRQPRESRPNTVMSRTNSLRPSYPLNGISRAPSVEPAKRNIIANSSQSTLDPLFTLTDMYSNYTLEETFIAREWVFREIYQSAIVEKVPLTIIQGAKGSGKSTIFNQLVLNSQFYSPQTSDTLDSGCVSDSSSLPSRNYEWLRAVAGRVAAYHICSIQSAASCSIPEFVCNLGALLAASPILKSYSQLLQKTPFLQTLLNMDECLKHNSLHIFKKAIAEPLSQLKTTDQGSLVVLIDGIDEAEFHRCEDGRSIGTFLNSVIPLLPNWMRMVITSDTQGIQTINEDVMIRCIRIDDCTLDERVVRDNRMFVEFKMSTVRELTEPRNPSGRLSYCDPLSEFSERLVDQSQGNMLYMKLYLELVLAGKLNIQTLAANQLPIDLYSLYTMYMNATFTSPTAFDRVCPILNILLASLRPLSRDRISEIIRSGGPETAMNEEELNRGLTILSPLLMFSTDDLISLHHSAFRDWLLADTHNDYQTDARKGHILIALWLTKKSPLAPAELMELSHHLLKAHPYKYMQGKYIPELTSTKDGQILWIQRCSEDISAALFDHRNMFYPNTKVSRLLLVAGADPSYTPPYKSASNLNRIQNISSVKTTSDCIAVSVSQMAVAAGQWQLISLLLHYGAGMNPHQGPSLLATAARFGHFDIVRQLLPIDNGRSLRESAIEATSNGHSRILQFLLSSQWASHDDKICVIEDCLCAAAEYGQTEICKYLVDNHPEIELATPMRFACESGCAETVQFFLSRGASLSSVDWPSDKPALHCAVASGSWDLVVAVLSLPGSSINQIDSEGKTALLVAAKHGHVGLVDMLINKGCDVNHIDLNGLSALVHSVKEGHLSCIQLLLEKDAELAITDNEGNSLAHIACAHTPRSIVDVLLQKGMLFEERNKKGDRPIETAIRNKNKPALEALLRRGARLRSTTWDAALECDQDSIFILLNKLIEDASILFRKKRMDDAMHRLHYALSKCESCLNEIRMNAYRARITSVKVQVLLAASRVHRRCGRLDQAVDTCHEAAALADNEEVLFEVLLLRAKCNFDRHDLDHSRADARAAAKLKPNSEEARHLLSTLLQPTTNIARF